MAAWSGLWDGVHGQAHSLIGTQNTGRKLRRALKGVTALKYKELLRTLVTDDVGSAAAASHTRITAGTPLDRLASGGVRTIETVADVARNVAAADETAILVDIDGAHTPTFPVEKSMNSGGGKLGF